MGREQDKSSSDEAVAGRENRTATTGTRGRFSEFLLLATGLAQFLTGAAMILVPSALPQYAWIVHSLARRGITGLPLYVGGVVLTGLWLSTRSNRARAMAVHETSASAAGTIEKLAGEVGHLGDGLQGLRIEFVYLKDALQTQSERAQTNTNTNTTQDNAGDGMFRLAASLDQLGARLEERLIGGHRELGQALQAVSTTVESLKVLSLQPKIEVAPERPAETTRHVEVHDDHARSSVAHDLDVTDDWDDDESLRSTRLGLLDMLDDLGRILPQKTSPAVDRPSAPPTIQIDPFHEVQDEGWEHAAAIPGPMPTARSGDELRLAGAGELLGTGSGYASGSLEDLPLGDKLAELRNLLADVRVRKALASIERVRR
jgi:hypothetical protein